MLRFRVLGMVGLDGDGGHVALGGPKQRALLAMLVLDGNAVVSRDRLIEGLWGERPPSDVEHALDVQVSALRRALAAGEAGRLVRRSPGYVLTVRAGEFDLDEFESLATEGRRLRADGHDHAAAEILGRALNLWRGPALSDVMSVPFAAEAARRLEERRLGAVEDRVDAQLATGDAPELCSELEALVAEHPFRERLIASLAVALYRAGRQAAALETIAAARRRFAEELGLQPGPALREVEAQILRDDPALLARPRRVGMSASVRTRRPPLRAVVAAVAALSLVIAGGAAVLHLARSDAARPALADVTGVGALALSSGDTLAAAQLPGAPAAIAADASGAWIADPDDNVVARVDPATGAVTARLTVAGAPAAIALGDGAVWTSSGPAGTVSRIDPQTQSVTQTIPVGGSPTALAFGAGGLWVADRNGRVLRLDPRTGRRTLTVALDDEPSAVAVDRRMVWVASYPAGTVTALAADSGAQVASVRVGGGPVAVATGAGSAWVANALDATVSQVTAAGGVRATIPVGGGPFALAFAAGALWVANESAGTVSRVDPRRRVVSRTMPVGARPTAIAVAGDRLWVGTRPTGVEHRGGTLRLVGTLGSATVDPQFQTGAGAPEFLGLSYDGLVGFRRAGGPRGAAVVPDLATALPDPSAGATRYTFRLRPRLRYWTGAPVRPSDFARSFERIFRARSPGTSYFGDLVGAARCEERPAACRLDRGVIADDAAGTVEFRLRRPDRDFLYRLAALTLALPIPPGTPVHDMGGRPIPGTGPYRIAHADRAGVRFVRNPHFREWSHAAQPAGYPDRIDWRFETDAGARVRAVRSGRADWLFGGVPTRLLTDVRNRNAAQLHINDIAETDFLQLNTTRPPFNDVRVRRALNYAVDRRAVVRIYGGSAQAKPACQVLPPGVPGRRPYCPYTKAPRHDGTWTAPELARAKRLVGASGTKGARVTVLRISDDLLPPPAVSGYVVSVLRRLGYRARVRAISRDAYNRLPAPDRDARQIGTATWLADFLSASNFFETWMTCDAPANDGRVCERRLDGRIARAHALETTDPERADELWNSIERHVVDAAYWVSLVEPREVELVSRRLGNYQYNELTGFLADQAWVR